MSTQSAASTPSATDPAAQLEAAFRASFAAVLGPEFADADPVIRPSAKPEFGDFQANGIMGLAKRMKANPREVAQSIADAVDVSGIAEPPEVAGPGFINLTLLSSVLNTALDEMDGSDLGIAPSTDTHGVVIDMCAVNVAKQMHVGHLRSTIIGDSLARTFERFGRTVYRENHLGDWGLPIAMVLHHLRVSGVDLDTIELTDLDRAYREAQLTARNDERGLTAARKFQAGSHRIAELEEQNAGAGEYVTAAKETLIGLQSGDTVLEADWNKLIDVTMRALFHAIDMMGVNLGPQNNRGESFYRDRLNAVVDEFAAKNVAREDDGALVVHFDDRERGMIIRKSDGGFLYATTDLAAVRFRTQELNADRVIYVVDARQRDHFRDVFDAVRQIGWDRTSDGTPADLHHIGFGSVLGADKKPLKTRSGENVTLQSLLDEAVSRGTREVVQRAQDPKAPTHGMPQAELEAIGRAVGIAAIKYADLSTDLVRDYVFDMDRMIRFEGDTGPYLQYAHARISSILAKAADVSLNDSAIDAAPFVIESPEEKQLALILLRYPATVSSVAEVLEPHRLCTFLSDLAQAYSSFYQQCPVLKADEPVRSARLRLCRLTRRVLADGLGLLGITCPDRM